MGAIFIVLLIATIVEADWTDILSNQMKRGFKRARSDFKTWGQKMFSNAKDYLQKAGKTVQDGFSKLANGK